MIHKKSRKYIPANLEIKWENLEPLFKELTERPINSGEELEHWLRDRSELEAALEEVVGSFGSGRYFATLTTDELKLFTTLSPLSPEAVARGRWGREVSETY